MKVTFTAQRCTLYTLTKNAIFYCVFFFLRKMTFCVTSFHSNLGWLNSWCIQKNKTIRVLAHNMTIFPLLFEIRTFECFLVLFSKSDEGKYESIQWLITTIDRRLCMEHVATSHIGYIWLIFPHIEQFTAIRVDFQ